MAALCVLKAFAQLRSHFTCYSLSPLAQVNSLRSIAGFLQQAFHVVCHQPLALPPAADAAEPALPACPEAAAAEEAAAPLSPELAALAAGDAEPAAAAAELAALPAPAALAELALALAAEAAIDVTAAAAEALPVPARQQTRWCV